MAQPTNNNKGILDKLIEDKEKALEAFPDLKKELEKFFKKPNCGVCRTDVIKGLQGQEKLILELTGVEMSKPQKPQHQPLQMPQNNRKGNMRGQNLEREAFVEVVKKEDWETWFKEFSKKDFKPVQVFDTFFDPIEETITVSYIFVNRK